MIAVPDDRQARRYLLGLATQDESAALEQWYLESDAGVALVAAAEDTLIEDYLEARLPTPEQQQFERHYLASAPHRARVEVVRQLRARARMQPDVAVPRLDTTSGFRIVRSIPGLPWKNWLALAASAAVVTGALWWLPGSRPVVDGATARDTVAATPASRARVVALSLAPVGVRGGAGDATRLVVPADADAIHLTLARDGEPVGVPSRAIVRTVSGEERWSGPVFADAADRAAAAEVEIPAALAADDYIVTLLARDASGTEREWLQYLLPVRRP